MKEYFISEINIEKLYHLSNITIELDTTKRQHLLLTGKNGSGKTSLLLRLVRYLKYEPILNCTTEPVEHLIAFRKTGYFGTDEKLEFVPVKDDNVAIRNTILLLNDAYYGTTPQKKMEARIIRKTLRKDLSKFKEYVREYQEAENEEEKEDIAMLLKRELKDSSAFTAFKRWLIWDNEEKYGELEKFIPENQKKKLFDI